MVRQQIGLAVQALGLQEQAAQALMVQEQGRMIPAVTAHEQMALSTEVREQAVWPSRKRRPQAGRLRLICPEALKGVILKCRFKKDLIVQGMRGVLVVRFHELS